jgi:signal peptidase II
MTDERRGAPRHRTYPWLMVGVAVVVLVADQLTKWWAVSSLKNQLPVDVAWTLRFRYAENTGASFSIGPGKGQFIAVVAVAVVVVILWTGRRVDTRLGAVARGLIAGGALGNVTDRVFRAHSGGFLTGGVVDFIDVQWWPIFNVADCGVVVGSILLVLSLLLEPRSSAEAPVGETRTGTEVEAPLGPSSPASDA